MTSIGISAFQGPNIHAKQPIVRLRIEAESIGRLSSKAFLQRTKELLPTTSDWQELRAVLTRLAETAEQTSLPIVLATLTRELQREPFGAVLPAWIEASYMPGKIDALVGIGDPDIGELAALLACQIARQLYSDEAGGAPDQVSARLGQALDRFERRRRATGYGENHRLLLAAAKARGVPARKLVRGYPFLLLGHGVRRVRLGQNAGDRTSALASRVSNDKRATAQALHRAGIAVPRQLEIERDEDVGRAVAEIGFPLVIKGRSGSKGRSVTANIRDAGEFEAALAKARRYGGLPLVEAHIAGTDYRLLVVGGRLVAAARRRAAQVLGDGRQSVRALLAEENQRRKERGGYAHWLVPLALDADSLAVLARQGLAPEDVPAAGQAVRLRSAGNISQGGIPEDVTDEVHPEIVETAIRAARVVGLDIAGVDVLTTDITRPLAETGGAVIEINHFPNLRPHYASTTPARDAAGAIIEHLFPEPHRGRIPLAAVTGTNGKTTTCRMLHRTFAEAGYCAGLTTTSGVFIGSERVLRGDYANALGVHAILQDPRVEAAVLETSRGGIIKKGLAWDSCDVAVITNISDDHVGELGLQSIEEVAHVKGMIVELARRAVVLNANDSFSREMAGRASAPIWWISSQPIGDFLKQHLSKQGNALVLEGTDGDQRLTYYAGAESIEVLRVADMPSSLGGLARHNVENALSASAAALALGLPIECLRKALSGFSLSFADSPGRLNIRDVSGARVILDFAHNMDAVAKMAAIAAQMPFPGQRICHLTTWGAYPNDFLCKLAATAAPLFDRFVITEAFRTKNPREHGEAARMVADGIVGAGVSPGSVTVEPNEIKSMDVALGLVRPGDLLLLLCDKHTEGWRKVQAFSLDTATEVDYPDAPPERETVVPTTV